MKEQILSLDQWSAVWLATHRSPNLTSFFQQITHLGSVLTIVLISLVVLGLLAYKKNWFHFITLGLAVSGGEILNEFLKTLFQRERPPFPWLTDASGYSFPSGHTLLSTILYYYIAYILYSSLLSSTKRTIFLLLLFGLPILVGISRIYLGVHYLSDVLGGWTIGILWILICIRIKNRYLSKKFSNLRN